MAAIDTINPLLDLHRQAEAEFQPYGPIEMVSTFGEPQAEYGAVRKACGMIDLPQRAIVEITGKDRLTFLNNLLSNQTFDKQTKTGLAQGAVVYAYLLHAKTGRIILDVNVIELGDRTLLEIDRRLVEPFTATLKKYHFSEAIEIHDRSNDHHEIALHGPGSLALLPQDQADVVVWRDDVCGVPGFNVILDTHRAREIWMSFITQFSSAEEIGKRPLRPIGWAAFNTTRIEAGRAMFGIDFDDSVLPAETGPLQLSRAVSFTKGCYPGQEIVARMHARSQTARQIVGFRMDDDALPIAGAQVLDEQSNVIGAVTSSTISPVLSGASIGLAMVKRSQTDIGKPLHIPAEGSIRAAKVVELPFVKGA